MNSRAHWLSLFSAIMHITMGLAGPLVVGQRFLPPSWLVIYEFVPGGEWVYPSAFVVTGVVAVLGIRSSVALRVGCRMSSVLFLAWGLAGLYLTWKGLPGGNIQGSFANLYTAGAALVLAYYVTVGVRGDKINEQVVRLAEKVHQANGHPPDAEE